MINQVGVQITMIQVGIYRIQQVIIVFFSSPRYRAKVGKEFFFRKIHYKDDYINWKNTTFKIYNLIRACRKPYPMAKSKLGNKIFYINEAYPFDNFIDKKIKAGTITNIFPDQSLLVKTMDGRILIKEYLCEKKIR